MTYGLILLVILTIIVFAAGVCTVPQQSAWVVERLGKYHNTLTAGLNFIIPFVDTIKYKHILKEVAFEIPEQVCITKDNVQVKVDGVLFLRIIDPKSASYGIGNYTFAVTQLAQTTLRSEIGKIMLDKTFEERQNINSLIVAELDKATEPWGIKVLRYEIKNITPPQDVLGAMEKQMRAEREKRSVILTSEGERDAKINRAEGDKQQVIKNSEATKQLQINEAEGRAAAILSVATATSEAIKQVGEAISGKGGMEAINLRVAEQWVGQFGNIAKESTTLILPANLGEVGSMVATALTTIKKISQDSGPSKPSA
jgi:regulator of protease activity HflC (stomatin/prohibitin superfamily)